MDIDKKIEILFGTILLGVLGYLAVNQFDMKGTLSAVSTKIDSTDQRVSRIADTLPDLRARVAWEELNYPFTGFVASSTPRKVADQKWETDVKIYDVKTQELKSWTFTLNEAHKDFVTYVVAGKVRAENPYNTSFAELASYAEKEKELGQMPATINAHTSFVIRSGDLSEYSEYMKKITKEDPTVRVLGQLNNWKELSNKFDEIK